MKSSVLLILCILFLGTPAITATAQHTVRPSVVKVLVTHRYPSLTRPWTKRAPQKSSGSGVVINGQVILTNAHVVGYASQIYIQAYQSDNKVSATVKAIAPEIDLAVLQLDDTEFFTEHPALTLSPQLPKVKNTVNVYGYPIGGNELSITEGIVSRIEFTRYHPHDTSGLRIQIDAALNPGNSGGPAMIGNEIVGLVFSGIREADNIGYLIPAEEIDTFLTDVNDGQYDGKPHLFDTFQTVENESLRNKLGLNTHMGGAMIRKPYGRDANPLHEWDIITNIGSYDLDREGKIQITDDLRLAFLYQISRLTEQSKVAMTVYRDGKSQLIDVPVKVRRDLAIPFLRNHYPKYFIYGPLVFSVATQEFVSSLGQARRFLSRSGSPLIERSDDEVAFPGEQIIVVCSPMFPHRITKGYNDPLFAVLSEVNDIQINNLDHLVEILRDSNGKYITFKFAGRQGDTLVFDRNEIAESTETILEENDIRYQGSKSARALWQTPQGVN